MQQPKQMAFTLMELMIALAVIGILATIATPSFNDAINKSRQKDGKEDVYRVMRQQERYFLNNMTYTTNLGDGGIGYIVNDDGQLTSPEGYFLLTAGLCADPEDIGQCVRITATGINSQAGTSYWLESDGDKHPDL